MKEIHIPVGCRTLDGAVSAALSVLHTGELTNAGCAVQVGGSQPSVYWSKYFSTEEDIKERGER